MTIIERTEEVVRIVKEHLDPSLPESDVKFVLSSVLNLGWQWDQTNAHTRAACVIASDEGDIFDIEENSAEELEKLEAAGSDHIIRKAGGMLKYMRLVAEFQHFDELMSIGNRLIPGEAEDNEEKENPKAD